MAAKRCSDDFARNQIFDQLPGSWSVRNRNIGVLFVNNAYRAPQMCELFSNIHTARFSPLIRLLPSNIA
jgi:hypothetical protein